METVSTTLLWELFKHSRQWLANLRRANEERKKQSKQALRRIITAARETDGYVRQLVDTGRRDHKTERKLSRQWTELGFELEDLGLSDLATKCQIKGKHWSNPGHYDRNFLNKADISLDRMEKIAQEILDEVKNYQ